MADQDIRRKLATIMVADIVGYSRLTAEDEDGTIRALADFRKVVDEIIERHEGRIFNTGGDSVLAEFDSPVEAVRCAVDFQQAARSRNLLQPRDRQLRFRIGINLGDVMVRGTDLLGDGVNVAARLEGLAEPGGICVSGTVWDHIHGKLSLGYVDIGEQTVKNIPRPVRAYQLRVDGTMEEVAAAPSAEALKAAATGTARKRAVARSTLAAGLVIVLAAAGGAGWYVWSHNRSKAGPARAGVTASTGNTGVTAPSAPLTERLSARVASIAPRLDRKIREDEVHRYTNGRGRKALAVSADGPGLWYAWERSTAENAVESALEGCQVYFSRPCILIAVDDKLEPPATDGHWPAQDMPRVRFAGDFEPAQIPSAWSAVRERSDVVGYRAASAPKAVSFHPILSRMFVVTEAANQRAAEEQALSSCNSDPVRNGRGGPCFLYAVGNRVVLPLRLREPLTMQ